MPSPANQRFNDECCQAWRSLLQERFPELPGLGIETFRGGWTGMTLDFLPFSNGHGVAQATLNGSMLADQVLGRPNEDVEVLRRRVIPIPPEPIRWLGVNGLKWYFDRIVDTDLRFRRVSAAPRACRED